MSSQRKRRDYYEVLGVQRSADAAQLKRAYRALALKHHPDQNPDNPQAEAIFKELSEAYTVLSDPEQRARYDRRGFEGVGGDAGFGVDLRAFTDLFENLFGDLFGKKKGKLPGRDLRYTLELGFTEAALGATKKITFPAKVGCEDCAGLGGKGGAAGMTACPACSGRGEIKVQQGFFTLGKQCPSCQGTGQTIQEPCPTCKGEGLVEKSREYDIVIPPGTEDGATRMVAGQGEAGRRGGAPGDLNVIVRVLPHPIFRHEGGVITCDVPISPALAALGATVDVPTLDGKVEMRVPPGTQSGTVFRLRGRGAGDKQGGRGDAHVRLVVETPVALTARQKELFEDLRQSLGEEQLPTLSAFSTKMKEKVE